MLDLVIIYDIFTCKEMPYNNTLQSLREMIDRQSYHDFVFCFFSGEADTRTRTCDFSLKVEGTCYCAEARPLMLGDFLNI